MMSATVISRESVWGQMSYIPTVYIYILAARYENEAKFGRTCRVCAVTDRVVIKRVVVSIDSLS